MVNHINKARLVIIVITGILLGINSAVLRSDIDRIQKLTAEGNLNEALELANKELQGDETNVTYRFLKGLVLTRMEKFDEASEVFMDITRTNPELPEPYNNLAVIYASQGDYDKARDLLEQAINTHPAYATAHENIGDIYAKLASQAYNQALELDRDNNTARAKLSLVNDLFSLPEATGPVAVAEAPTQPEVNTEQQRPANVREPEPTEQVVTEQTVAMVDEEEIRAKEQELIRQNQELEQRITISQVKQTVLDWAAAWSRQDVDAYLSYYASDFSSDDGRTPAQWREYRRDRISSPGNIEVVISDLVVDMLGSDHAQATFTQIYRSPSYGDRVKKTLLMKLEQNNWRITQEDT